MGDRVRYVCFGMVVGSEFALPFPEVRGGDLAGVLPDLALVGGSVVGPVESCVLMHDVVDWVGGPRLEVFRSADGSVLICYDVWRIRLGFAERQIVVESVGVLEGVYNKEGRTGFDLVMERLALPLYVLFAHENVLGLHGSAVAFGGRAWVFIGESGAGKSTTAHELLARGGMLLADDMSLVDVERLVVRPGSPSIRLWKGADEVEGAVFDRQIHEQTTKRWFRIADERAVVGEIALGGIVWLHPTEDLEADGAWERSGGRAGLVALLKQTFDFTQPEVMWMMARFQNASRLLKRVPMFEYRYRRSENGEPTHVAGLVEHLMRENGAG